MTISTFMAQNHKRCDELLTDAENLAVQSDWTGLRSAFNEFTDETEKHLAREEGMLFPRLEETTGSVGGPTQVMRMEHDQIRLLIKNLNLMVDQKDRDGILGEAETLLIMIAQHNVKEEQILYPMMDRILAADAESILEELNSS